jgi:pyruvate formate lyase activating enzyme
VCKCSFNCVTNCPANVFKKAGKYYEIPELIEQLKSNKVFYDNTGGGVTFSGGEPLMYPSYAKELINNLKAEGINILIETCGLFKIDENIDNILKNVDIIYFDIKILDAVNHKKYCGVDNTIIIENFRAFINKYNMILPKDKRSLELKTKEHEKPLLIPRIPLVPDVTMTTINLKQIRDFLKKNNVKLIDLLQYNPLWIEKSKSIGVAPKYTRTTWMQKEELSEVREIFAKFNFVSFQ